MLPLNRNIALEVLGLPAYWLALWQKNRSIEVGQKIRYGKHARQHFRWFPPQGPLRAWLIYYHGGGWQFGSPYHFRALADIFQPMGIGVVLPAYRGLISTDYRGMKSDLQQFYVKLSSFAQAQGLPVEKLIVGGMSAGGHLAALSVLDPDISKASFDSSKVLRGVFLSGAVLNLDEMPPSILLRRLAGKKGSPNWIAANPMSYLDQADLPNCMLTHGSRDGMVPLSVAESFFAKAKEKDEKSIHLNVIEGGSHLDVGRWIYRADEQRERVIKFVEACINEK